MSTFSRSSRTDGIDRRDFVKTLAAAGPVVGLGSASGQTQSRAQDARLILDETSISELASRMAAGELTSHQITQWYLERIERTDRKGPTLRSLIEVNPEALRIADELDQERKTKGPRSPIHGIPIVLKDNIDTHDRMTTTAGSFALENSIPTRDSGVASRLREAGAVLLAKANLSEWANFRSDYSSSGWSARGGQCRNPYILERNPCGSSSGSAVAVSANLCVAAIGTETNGSIVCPSNANGVVGIKPTVGLVSRAGIVPIAHSQDTAGPMARSVADAAILLGILAGPDDRDPVTRQMRSGVPDYRQSLDPDGLKGARVGVARDFAGFHPGVDKLFDAAIKALKDRGAEIIDPVKFEGRSELGKNSFQVLLYEFKADLNAYLANLGDRTVVRSLADLIAFNKRNEDREMPFFGQDVFITAQEKGPLTSTEYLESLAKCRQLSRENGIDKLMATHRLDAIVAPTGGPAWLTDHVNGDHFMGGSSSPAAIAGYPNISVPMGFVHELPVGISFFGRAWTEAVLIRLAYAFEQATKARKSPRFLREAEVRSSS